MCILSTSFFKKLVSILCMHSLEVTKFTCMMFFLQKKKKKRGQSISVISTLAVSGRWYRGCRQVGAQNPKWECATLTNTEGYWTSKRDCQPSQENPNCLHGLAKLDRSEDRAWILP